MRLHGTDEAEHAFEAPGVFARLEDAARAHMERAARMSEFELQATLGEAGARKHDRSHQSLGIKTSVPGATAEPVNWLNSRMRGQLSGVW